MSNTKRDEHIVMVGELVKYNGNINHAPNTYTIDLMVNNLTVGNFYEVDDVRLVAGDGYFYRFRNAGGEFWYPYKSFDHCCAREVLIKKYNLR